MLSDHRPDASPLPFSIVPFLQVFGRLALLQGTPVCFRQHLRCISFRAHTSRHRHLFAGLFGCNRLRALLFICHSLIYIHSCLSVSVSIVSSALKGCVPMFPCSYVRGSLSLFSPSIICSSVQDPGGPAPFLHARA